MFEVEKNEPIPDPEWGRNRYPFLQMEVGDRFVVPKELRTSVLGSAVYFAKRHPEYKFSGRTIDADTFGIWRVPVIEE